MSTVGERHFDVNIAVARRTNSIENRSNQCITTEQNTQNQCITNRNTNQCITKRNTKSNKNCWLWAPDVQCCWLAWLAVLSHSFFRHSVKTILFEPQWILEILLLAYSTTKLVAERTESQKCSQNKSCTSPSTIIIHYSQTFNGSCFISPDP